MKKPITPEAASFSPALRALSDATRLKILLMLEGRRRTVGEIVGFFELSQPTITRHLQTLADAGLVKREKEGQKVYYSVDGSALGAVCVGLASTFPCCCVSITPQKTSDVAARSTSRPRHTTKTRIPKGD
jgi:ArsR family transcriptional regulator